jgi:hypothetical protein
MTGITDSLSWPSWPSLFSPHLNFGLPHITMGIYFWHKRVKDSNMKYSVISVSINTVIKGHVNKLNGSNPTIDPHRQNFYVLYNSFIFLHN